jgi:hypothetical protein
MSFQDGFRLREFRIVRIVREIALRQMRQFWRELARPVTFFDLCSPRNFVPEEIGEIPKEKRARQDSNLRPPA